jgi:predicted nucleic acid-binding protein
MVDVLLDTSAVFALLNPDDDHHAGAIAIHDSLIRRKVTLVLPNFLLAECHAILNKRLGPQAARGFLNAALQDFAIERVSVEDEWAAHAMLQTVSRLRDLSYFDAVAIVLAQRLGIKDVFSFDRHFALMGLKPAAA